MRWNRKKFFDGVKDRIDPTLSQEQVDGFEFLLTSFENDPQWKDVRHCAYGLATVFHETAYSMQPVEEGYYLGSKARVQRFQKTLRYYPYFGRGYVQLTWKKNYEKAGKAFGVDLVANPALALTPDIAFKCLGGMFKGWYGGKLSTYINGNKTDYVNARRCVNILDKAGLIAGHAKSFEKILNSAATSTATSVAANQTTTNTATSPATQPLESPPIEINQEAETIINEQPSIMDKVSQAGDKFSVFQGTLDKFGFSVEDAKRSVWTILLTGWKVIASGVMIMWGVLTNHWELFLIAALFAVIAYLVWDKSGKRVAEAKAGIPADVAKQMIEKM